MDPLDIPTTPSEAFKQLQARRLMPVGLTSAEIREMDAALRRTSMISARTLLTNLLDKYKNVVGSILQPGTETRADKVTTDNPQGKVTTGFNPVSGRQEIKSFLDQIGYTPKEGTAGTLMDLSSAARINLVIKTNSETAWGAGSFVQQNSNPTRVQDYPALQLYRITQKNQPRAWSVRWNLAAQESGDVAAAAALAVGGMMAALKDSPIWQALGDGAGGFDDTLGNPYPPFAFQSGMWTRDVSRAKAIELGLMDDGEEAKPAAFDFASLFGLEAAA